MARGAGLGRAGLDSALAVAAAGPGGGHSRTGRRCRREGRRQWRARRRRRHGRRPSRRAFGVKRGGRSAAYHDARAALRRRRGDGGGAGGGAEALSSELLRRAKERQLAHADGARLERTSASAASERAAALEALLAACESENEALRSEVSTRLGGARRRGRAASTSAEVVRLQATAVKCRGRKAPGRRRRAGHGSRRCRARRRSFHRTHDSRRQRTNATPLPAPSCLIVAPTTPIAWPSAGVLHKAHHVPLPKCSYVHGGGATTPAGPPDTSLHRDASVNVSIDAGCTPSRAHPR